MTRPRPNFALLFIAAAALAQQSDGERVIAVNVDSTDSRIQQMLREKAAKVIEQSAKNVHASIVIGSPLDAAEQAR
jgi:CO dehydrogenase/acetyl-CoA synthase delta subunit